MKKKYSTPNLIKAVSLSAAMVTLLSSVSPVFAANFAFVGGNNNSTSGTGVSYLRGSHGSVVLAGDDDFCGVDNVKGRGGKQQENVAKQITAQEQYDRFINNQAFSGRNPYGTTTEKVVWQSAGILSGNATYMGANTEGSQNIMPEAFGVYSFVTGCGAAATGNYSTAFGAGATTKAGGAQAFGVSALASGKASVAMGVGSEASKESTIAIGGLATASGKNSISIGKSSQATLDDAIAVGSNAEGKGINSVAIGNIASASGYNSVALGLKTKATEDYTVAIGSKAEAQALGSIAIGGGEPAKNGVERKVIAKGKNSIAIGSHTYAEMAHSVAIGINAQVRVIDGVAVGGGSVSRVEAKVLGYDPATNTTTTKGDLAWKSTGGDFSVGNTEQELTRQITNVAAGSKDTDAVNVAQLKAMREVIAGGGGAWKLSANNTGPTDVNSGNTVDFSVKNSVVGKDNLKITKSTQGDKHKIQFTLSDTLKLTQVTTGQSSMSDDGFIIKNGPMMTIDGVNAGNKKITNVVDGTEDSDAVNYKQLKEIKEAATTHWQLSVNGGNGISIGQNDTVNLQSAGKEGSQNIKIVRDNNRNVAFDLADDINVMTVTAGDSVMDAVGFRFDGGEGPSITVKGIHAGNKTIKGVADGKSGTDAVNYNQLTEVKKLAEKGWKLSVDGNNATDVGVDSTVDLVTGADDNNNKNIKIIKSNGNKVTFTLNSNLKLTSVTTGNSVMNSDGFKFVDGGPSITANGIDAGNKKITKVETGTEDTDAVNYKQLKDFTAGMETGWKLSVDGNNATKVKAGSTVDFVAVKHKNDDNSEGDTANIKIVKNENNKVSFDLSDYIKVGRVETGLSSMSNDGFMIKGGPRMTNGGIHAANTKITGVQKGTNESDAVNVSQLKTVEEKIKEVEDNSLVKWDDGKLLITIGAEKGGKTINIANNGDENRNITGVADGIISEVSTEAVNGSQLFTTLERIDRLNDYFGGGADVIKGQAPTYTVQKETHQNVGSAFEAIDTSITDIYNQINNVTENSLVKWEKDQKLITIGKEKGGEKINIAGTEGERTIAGVKNGKISEESHEAINGSQINKISGDIAKFFGGNTAFQDGVFVGPRYNLSKVSTDGTIERKTFENVGDALEELDVNVRNVNTHIQYVDKKFDDKFDKIYQDALLWSDQADAFVALHGENGKKTNSKIKYLEKGDITKDSTDAINGSQLFNVAENTSKYFGGETDVIDGIAPTFIIGDDKYDNVTEAFTAVDNSITDIYNQINNVTENSLVKWDESKKLITIGKDKAGTEISILNNRGMDRKLSGVKDGVVSPTSTEAVNGSQLFKTNENVTIVTNNLEKVAKNTSKYFGGSTDVLNGVKPTFVIGENTYDNVTEAFTGVNISIHKIDNKISDVIKNSLVKQDENTGLITIGKDTAGTEINIAGYASVARKISGVQAAEKGDEAVNKDQLDKSIKDITKDIEKVSAAAVLYDKDADGNVNYESVTLGGEKGAKPVALHNVKDGSISQDSKDAINGSQINKISEDIAKFFGGGAKFVDGAFKGLKYTLSAIVDGQVGKANFYDVGSALTGLDKNVKDVNQRLTKVSNKFNQTIEGISKDALLWDDKEGAFVARHEKDGKKTNSKLKYLLDGEIAQGSTDAITGNQLYLMSNQLANYFGGGAKYENGQWTNPTFKIVQVNADGTTVEKNHNNVADAFGDVNKNMSNINNRIDDVINKVDSDALKWNEDKKAYDANRDGKPSKITGVADGKIAEGSKDAVNGGQLWKTNERVTGVEKDVKHLNNRVDNISNTIADIGDVVNNIGGKVDNINNRVDVIEEDAVRYDRDENGKKVNKITLKGGDASEPVLIDNVADGKIEKGSKEAVNGGQLHDYTKEQTKLVLDESKHYTDQRIRNITIDAIDDAVERAKQYTDMKFDALNYSIESVKKEARQAAAIGLAVSNLRYNDTPGKLSVGFGTGLWRSQSAFAFGAGYTSEKGNIRSNVSVTTSGGHWGVGAGFNMTLN
ncbi:Vomp family autotransporter [Bartonella tribocorum]|uniref:Surface protein/Bartonella adhesin n=1 Tax=Bartonella tribocorum TaxID=85701 RepID=A0A2M6UVW3_9HYPH|nr:Vomp family autotransporter [Bartonella tribocorum]PIT70306.1 hypothetical protein CER18_00940 [Bartonella tribocorum]